MADLCAFAVGFLLLLSPLLHAELLVDPSFEATTLLTNWVTYQTAFSRSTTVKLSGTHSISATSKDLLGSVGAYQELTINGLTAIRFSGWSLSSANVSLPSDSNYAIQAALTYANGVIQWVAAPFSAGSPHTWQYSCETIVTDAKVTDLVVYALFQSHTGTAYFDLFSVVPYTIPTVVTSKTYPVRLIVPLYMYPGSEWDAVQAQSPYVSITVVANPAGGPGTSQKLDYVNYINQFVQNKTSPVTVLGYIWTDYAQRNVSDVESDILAWKSFYPNINGIFFDGVDNTLDYVSYYGALSNFVKSTKAFGSKAEVFLNPGSSTPENYTTFSDSITFFENSYSVFATPPSQQDSLSSGWPIAPCYNAYSSTWKYKSSGISYNVTSTQYKSAINSAISKGFGYVYMTDSLYPNPYNVLPSYWASMVSYIASLNK